MQLTIGSWLASGRPSSFGWSRRVAKHGGSVLPSATLASRFLGRQYSEGQRSVLRRSKIPQNRTMFISSPPTSLEFFFLVVEKGGWGEGCVTLSDNINLNELNITASMYLTSEAQSSFFLIYVVERIE